jgi:hypothetical protein
MTIELAAALAAIALPIVGALVALAVAWGRVTKAIEEIAKDVSERGEKHHRLANIVTGHQTRIAVLEDRLGLTPVTGIRYDHAGD